MSEPSFDAPCRLAGTASIGSSQSAACAARDPLRDRVRCFTCSARTPNHRSDKGTALKAQGAFCRV